MIDITQPVTQTQVKQLVQLGHSVIGVYARADRATKETVDAIHVGGAHVLTIWEKGKPTSPAYFTIDQAKADFDEIMGWCHAVGQPKYTTISPAYDYDARFEDVSVYAYQMHGSLMSERYFQLPYGSGHVITEMNEEGIAITDIRTGKGGWLAGSTAWTSYDKGRHQAAIIQTTEDINILGIPCDADVFVQNVLEIEFNRHVSLIW